MGRWCGSVDNGDVDDDGCDGESDSCSVKREGWETDRQRKREREGMVWEGSTDELEEFELPTLHLHHPPPATILCKPWW